MPTEGITDDFLHLLNLESEFGKVECQRSQPCCRSLRKLGFSSSFSSQFRRLATSSPNERFANLSGNSLIEVRSVSVHKIYALGPEPRRESAFPDSDLQSSQQLQPPVRSGSFSWGSSGRAGSACPWFTFASEWPGAPDGTIIWTTPLVS